MYVTIYGQALQNNPMYALCGESCPSEDLATLIDTGSREEIEQELAEIEESIAECEAMVHHFIQLRDKNEVAYWRGALQNLKIEKRSIKKALLKKRKNELLFISIKM